MSQHRRKTLRSFYCEEDLWHRLEQTAKERDVPLDQLLNLALRGFVEGGAPAPAPVAAPAPAPAAPLFAEPAPRVKLQPELRPAAPAPSAEPAVTFQRMPSVPPAAPPAPFSAPPAAPVMNFGPPPAPPAAPSNPGLAPRPPAAPPATTGSNPALRAPAAPAAPAVLYITVDGETHIVDKERFVIGRGTQGTDLTIRDGNISRKHAAVIFHGGHYYIQDLGSTNGVEYQGNRVDTKKIEDGDAFFICDHELVFNFRG